MWPAHAPAAFTTTPAAMVVPSSSVTPVTRLPSSVSDVTVPSRYSTPAASARTMKAAQHLSRVRVSILRPEHAEDDVVQPRVRHQLANLVRRQHSHAGSRAPFELVAPHQRRRRCGVGQEQVTALAEPRPRSRPGRAHAPVERLPEPDAVLHHLHGDRGAELLADAAHRQERRGAEVAAIALDDHDAAGEPVLAQMPRDARADDAAADDDDVSVHAAAARRTIPGAPGAPRAPGPTRCP